MKAAFVINPRSANGATGRRLGELRALAGRYFEHVEILETRAQGDGSRLALQAAQTFDRVIAVGGDGTANEVVNGLVQAGVPDVAFGVLPAGTGSDLVKTIGIQGPWEQALPRIAAAEPRLVDVMEGTFTDPAGQPSVRFGMNVIGLGLAGDVVRRVNTSSKALGGHVTFLVATVRAAIAWTAPSVTLSWIDARGETGSWTGPLVNAFVSNGQFCGGGMWVGRGGRMDDGLLDLVVVPDIGIGRLLLQTPMLYDGSIATHPAVVSVAVREVTARPTNAAAIPADVDGEQPGHLPVRVRCVPKALRVCMGADALG